MSVLTTLRDLRPASRRPLTINEARQLAERQANAWRTWHGLEHEPLIPTETLVNQPRLRVHLATSMRNAGLTGWDDESKQWQVVISCERSREVAFCGHANSRWVRRVLLA